MKIGFDVISDLNISLETPFSWEGKATSLYCIVAGNISFDTSIVKNVLTSLGEVYQGVFYIPGSLEYDNINDIESRTSELALLCSTIRNVVFLHQHVVIIDGIAIIACNGWFGNTITTNNITGYKIEMSKYDDLIYLKNSIEKLQLHLDVTKIVIVTNSVPDILLYYGETPLDLDSNLQPNIVLLADTMKKVSHWIFGTYEKIVDTVNDNINYVNNPCFNRKPYWAKRVDIEV